MWTPEVWTSKWQELWSRKVLAGNALKSLSYSSWCPFCLLAGLPSHLLFILVLCPPSVMAVMVEKNEARITSAVWPHLSVFLSVQLQLWKLVVMRFCCRVLNVLGLVLPKLNFRLVKKAEETQKLTLNLQHRDNLGLLVKLARSYELQPTCMISIATKHQD